MIADHLLSILFETLKLKHFYRLFFIFTPRTTFPKEMKLHIPKEAKVLNIKSGEFPNNIRANNMKTKLVSNNIKMKRVSLNIKIKLFTRVLVVKSFHYSNDSLEKVWKLQIKFFEFDCLTGYSVLFLCYLKLISILCYWKLILFLCYLLLCYLVRNH